MFYKYFFLSFYFIIINCYNITNTTNNITLPYLKRKTKYCNFKCNCFFSHSVKNDNICVPYWIRTPGLN